MKWYFILIGVLVLGLVAGGIIFLERMQVMDILPFFQKPIMEKALVLGTNAGFVTTAPTADPAGGGAAQLMDDLSRAVKDTSPSTAIKITEIGWWADTASEEANFEVGIYDHDATNNEPENLLAGADLTNAKGTGAGWKVVTGLNITISPSTIYWIAVQVDNTASATNVDFQGSIAGARYVRTGLGQTALQDPFVTAVASADATLAIYAVWEAGGDTSSPQWSNNQTNSTLAGTLINHTVLWTDDVALANYTFSFDNGTGTFVNDSSVSMTGTSNQSSVIKYVNQTVGSTIRWRVWAWDTAGNNNVTSIFAYNVTALASNCWVVTSGKIAIPPSCRFEVNTNQGFN